MKFETFSMSVILMILMLPYIILMSNFKFLAFDRAFYRQEFVKNNVYSQVPNADEVSDNLLVYLQSGTGTLNSSAFTEKEISHMADVKSLMDKFILALKVLVIVFLVLLLDLVYDYREKAIVEFSKALTVGAALSIVAIGILSLALVYFNSAFIGFHEALFSNTNWLLSPDTMLIRLYPQQFFYDITARILLWSFVSSIYVFLIGVLSYLHFKSVFKKTGEPSTTT